MNGRAYRNGDGYEPASGATCPSCKKVTSVQNAGSWWWCADCDLAFYDGDAERVSPGWVRRFQELREEEHRHTDPPPVHADGHTIGPAATTEEGG